MLTIYNNNHIILQYEQNIIVLLHLLILFHFSIEEGKSCRKRENHKHAEDHPPAQRRNQ